MIHQLGSSCSEFESPIMQVLLDTGSSDLWVVTANVTLQDVQNTGVHGEIDYGYVHAFFLRQFRRWKMILSTVKDRLRDPY